MSWLQTVYRTRKTYLGCLVLFLASCLAIGFDRGLTDSLHESTMPMDFWLQLVTWFGDGRLLIPGCLFFSLAMVIMKQPRAKLPLFALASFLASGAVAQFLKMIIGRPRPYLAGDLRYMHMPLDLLQGFTLNKDFSSFPSGHSTAVFSIAWFVAGRTQNRMGRFAVIFMATLVAISRIALWKHFVADTMAGAAIGICTSQLILEMLERMPSLAPVKEVSKEDTLPTA